MEIRVGDREVEEDVASKQTIRLFCRFMPAGGNFVQEILPTVAIHPEKDGAAGQRDAAYARGMRKVTTFPRTREVSTTFDFSNKCEPVARYATRRLRATNVDRHNETPRRMNDA